MLLLVAADGVFANNSNLHLFYTQTKDSGLLYCHYTREELVANLDVATATGSTCQLLTEYMSAESKMKGKTRSRSSPIAAAYFMLFYFLEDNFP